MYGFEKDAGVVVGILPEHDASQLSVHHILAFGGDGLRIFVSDEYVRLRIVEIGNGGFGIPVAEKAGGEQIGKLRIGKMNSFSGFAGLKEAMIFIGDLSPASTVEGKAQDDLASGNSCLLIGCNGKIRGDVLGIS